MKKAKNARTQKHIPNRERRYKLIKRNMEND